MPSEPVIQLKPIVLASGSIVRRRLLRAAGVQIRIKPADVDEGGLIAELGSFEPANIAVALAEAKALARRTKKWRGVDPVVIAADQLLTFDGRILQKARDMEEAHKRLWAMRGGVHALHGGCVLAQSGEIIWRHVSVARVTMRDYSEAALDMYLAAAGEAVLQSVACYEIEALGAQLIERVEGDYFSALGLPLLPLIGGLKDCGALRK